MKDRKRSKHRLQRRDVIKGAASAGLISTTALSPMLYAAGTRLARPDLVRLENAKPGTRDWLLTKTPTMPRKINRILDDGRCREIRDYCSANSIRAGETLKLMVSTNPASDFKLKIFRTGYYGGSGALLMKSFESLKLGTRTIPSTPEWNGKTSKGIPAHHEPPGLRYEPHSRTECPVMFITYS